VHRHSFAPLVPLECMTAARPRPHGRALASLCALGRRRAAARGGPAPGLNGRRRRQCFGESSLTWVRALRVPSTAVARRLTRAGGSAPLWRSADEAVAPYGVR